MSEQTFVVTVTRQTFFKETAALGVTAKDEETAIKEAIKYAKKNADNGNVAWDREQLSRWPRINLVDCVSGGSTSDDAFIGIPDSTVSDNELPSDEEEEIQE